MKCYEVEVKTIDNKGDTTRVPFEQEGLDNNFDFYDCIYNKLFVITNDPKLIYDKFQDAVISIKEIGIGYFLDADLNAKVSKLKHSISS